MIIDISFQIIESIYSSWWFWPGKMNLSCPPVFRRNQPGDRQRALDIMLPLVESEEQVASDIYCLVGRIYKDMFQDSHYSDTPSRDSSIQWWAKALFANGAGRVLQNLPCNANNPKRKWHMERGRAVVKQKRIEKREERHKVWNKSFCETLFTKHPTIRGLLSSQICHLFVICPASEDKPVLAITMSVFLVT